MTLVVSAIRNFLKAQVLLGLFVFLGFCFSTPAHAQEARSYTYDSISFVFHVNQDTTVDVAETQTYRFVGEYHQGWRSIPKKGFDDLEGVTVTDDMTGRPLQYVDKRLDKTQPSSWGKYTTFVENDAFVIEWYYNARDTVHTWTLRYKLRGALGFYNDHDEFYWNLFTDYPVAIGSVTADVFLPVSLPSSEVLKETLYVTGAQGMYGSSHAPEQFSFYANNLGPQAKVTIAPGWPKGIVDVSAYKRYWWWTHWGMIGSGIVIIVTIIGLFFRWYLTERYHTGRGTIVPEYEPPQHLPPAMADVIIHERLSPQAWAATVVDLAVRGCLKIREEKESVFVIIGRLAFILVVFGIVWFMTGANTLSKVGVLTLLFGVHFLIALMRNGWSVRNMLVPKSYALDRVVTDDGANMQNLQEFERAFLRALFKHGQTFSFKEIRKHRSAAMNFYQKTQEIKKSLLQETASDTGAYEVDFKAWKFVGPLLFISPFVYFFVLITMIGNNAMGLPLFLATLAYCGSVAYLFIRFNPRLNQSGQILKEEWLGFKMYLETAERYRLQNLTPETFEKFLPYAMIFGVEKKWGEAFKDMELPPPSWYAGTSISSGGFSPTSFTSSFSTSFSTAFSSAGGGASGGGGSAGGGGGGGGGGAS